MLLGARSPNTQPAARLDFGLWPDLSSSPAFIAFDSETERKLEDTAPTAFARLEAALRFVWWVQADQPCKESQASRLREAYLRAALSEFASSEEALARDLGANECVPLRFVDCPDPHIRLMREVRNLEIHLHSSQLRSESRDAVLRIGGDSQSVKREIWLAEDLTEERFRALKNARHYSPVEISALVDWFNSAQQVWGVDHLVFLAICSFSKRICQRHSR